MRLRLTAAAAAVLLAIASPAFATDPQFGAIRVEASPNVRHAFVSAQSQSANSSLVSRNEWNAAHTVPTALIVAVPTGLVWPAQPAAVTEFCGGSTSYRWRADLTNQTSIRLTAQVVSAGAATSALRLQYTLDTTGATGWDYLDGVSGPSVSTSSSGVTTSATVSITAAAKAEVLLRLVGINGDGAGGTCYSAIKAATATLADTATTVTTNANLTGPITSVGNATTVAETELAALAGLTSAADKLPYFTGSGTAALADFSSANRSALAALSGTNTGDQTSVTGNAGTATALAANGSNCTAGNYARGVDASGAAEDCTAVPAAGLTVGSTTVASGNSGRVLYNNAGTLGEYTISGSGSVSMTTGPTFGGTVTFGSSTAAGNATTLIRDTITTSNSFLSIAGRLPTATSGASDAVAFTFSTSASDTATGAQRRGMSILLTPETPGTGITTGRAVGLFIHNTSESSQAAILQNGTSGLYGLSLPTAANVNFSVGVVGDTGASASVAVGTIGLVRSSGTPSSVGVLGRAPWTGGGTNSMAGAFELSPSVPGLPAISAAIYGSNNAVATNLFVLSDGGAALPTTGATATWSVIDGATAQCGNCVLTSATMTAETQGNLKESTHSYTWTNAQVAALGAVTTGDITVTTLPAKTQVLDAMVVITGAAAGPATVTVSCGDAIAGAPFINYVVASDAKAAANTVYGDAVAERGTSIDTEFWYLPSYTATTLVTCRFISTGGNLSTVTGSTGRVILTTRLLP